MTREPEPTPERPGPESPRAAPDSALAEDALDRVLGAAFGSRPRAAPNEAASGALHAGARVRHLRVVRLLGRGGMGELHLAHDERLGRDVALKAIHKGARLSDEARARFKREARILAGLDHPGICRIHEYLETPEADYLVLELIDGEPLRARGPRQAGAAALELCIQIASALEAAHAAGIVHRDLKPSNVMVTREGQVKVLDFGVARALRDTERARPRDVDRAQIVGGELTHAGAVIGTLAYMSPEQARGEEAGAASDVYSFGLLVQELWTGEAARDEGLAPLELLARVERGERRPLRGVPPEIERLVAELCAVQPSARPTAAAARERLAWILAAPRRRARRVAIGGAAALLLAIGAKYTLDLRAAHAASTANLERADGLIDFMHEDLWEKLDGIGRLDVLEDICERSTAYFESLDAEGLSDDQLAGHARTLRHIGIVWRDKAEDSLDRADEAFRRSHGWSELLAERAPGDPERKFERGQAEFYVGDLAFVRRDWAEALVWFRRYHATSEELLAEAPEDPDLAMEVAWARQGIGAVLLKRAEPEGALAEFEAAAGTWRRLLEESPEDPALREEQASVESWIAEAALANGELEAAAEAAESSLGRWQALSSEDAERRDHAFTAVVAVQRVARIELERNEAQSALERLEESRGTLERLVEWDPENGEWARSLAIHWAHVARARLALGETEAARVAVDRALTSLSELLEFDPGNADLLYERGAAWVVAGEQAAAAGELERARECARLALADFGEERGDAEPGEDSWPLRAGLMATQESDD